MIPAAIQLALVTLCALATSGCASIMSGRHAEVAINTFPSHAHVVVHDQRGRQVTSFHTPGVATLKRQGKFLMPASYTATIAAPGYTTTQLPIDSTINPWIVGNVLIGGIPGLVIDTVTGAVWRPSRSEINQRLSPIVHEPNLQQGPASAAETQMPPWHIADDSANGAATSKLSSTQDHLTR